MNQSKLMMSHMRSNRAANAIVSEAYCFPEETQLTVHKTSVFFPGDSFAAYNPAGKLLFRYDSYGPGSEPKDELFLMDASGECLLTLVRKRPSLRQRWEAFLGERREDQGPLFEAHRSAIIGPSSLLVEIYGGGGDPRPRAEYHYQVEGSYPHRCCTFYNCCCWSPDDPESPSKEPMAEIRWKVDPTTGVTLGKDVFLLCLRAGFDGAFAMGLVLLLDQIYGDDDGGGGDGSGGPGAGPLLRRFHPTTPMNV